MAEIPGDDVRWNGQASLQLDDPAKAIGVTVHEGRMVELQVGHPIPGGASKDPIKKVPGLLSMALFDEGRSLFQRAPAGSWLVPWPWIPSVLGLLHLGSRFRKG